jgi:hypothetical protein
MGVCLAVSLQGQAQAVLANLHKDDKRFSKKLTGAFKARFATKNQTELYRSMLQERTQYRNGTLLKLGESIRRLVFLVYPTAPRDVTEQLAKDHFMDSLTDFDTKLRVQQPRPASLNGAVRLVVEVEAFL